VSRQRSCTDLWSSCLVFFFIHNFHFPIEAVLQLFRVEPGIFLSDSTNQLTFKLVDFTGISFNSLCVHMCHCVYICVCVQVLACVFKLVSASHFQSSAKQHSFRPHTHTTKQCNSHVSTFIQLSVSTFIQLISACTQEPVSTFYKNEFQHLHRIEL
jgi:uncharacterized membrane protein (UPF0182 family)